MTGEERITAAGRSQLELEDIASELWDKARAAATLGLPEQAKEFQRLSRQIEVHARKLHQCWSDEFHEHMLRAQGTGGQLLQAALAGCELSKREDK